jgi:hypothetical protein
MKIDQFAGVPELPMEVSVCGECRAPRYKRPTKEEIRTWLARAIASQLPPPSIDEIRRDLWQRRGDDEDGAKS